MEYIFICLNVMKKLNKIEFKHAKKTIIDTNNIISTLVLNSNDMYLENTIKVTHMINVQNKTMLVIE